MHGLAHDENQSRIIPCSGTKYTRISYTICIFYITFAYIFYKCITHMCIDRYIYIYTHTVYISMHMIYAFSTLFMVTFDRNTEEPGDAGHGSRPLEPLKKSTTQFSGGGSWDFHGIFMGFSWDFHGIM